MFVGLCFLRAAMNMLEHEGAKRLPIMAMPCVGR